MTSTPQSAGRQETISFSAAWDAFAYTHKAAQPSVTTAGDEPRATGQTAEPADVPAREKPVADAADQMPDTGRSPSATVAASIAGNAQLQPGVAASDKSGASAAPTTSAHVKPGLAEACFSGLSHAAFLALPLLLLAQFAMGLAALTPWLLPQEAIFARSYELMAASGHWLMAPAALPPGWFWVLRLLDALPWVDGPVVYAAGAALSGVLTLLATWFLALSAGYGRRAAFASGLVLLSCLAFPALTHRVGPELLFTGLLTMGLACLLRGWNKDRSFLRLPLGCAFVALAGLTHGVFGIILPVLGTLVFLAWKGAFARLNRADGAAGFAVLLALPLAWLGAALLFVPGDAQLQAMFMQIIAPYLPPWWPPKDPAWFYAAVLPLSLAPWTLVPLFVSWGSVLARPLASLSSTRKENSGSAWIWIHLVAGLLLLSATSSKFCLNILPLMPLLAIVLGKAIVNLPQRNSRAFFLVPAALFGLAALALGLAGVAQIWPPLLNLAPFPAPQGFAAIRGLPILAGICLLSALTLWKLVDRRFPGACLLVCAIAVTVLCLPALRLTSPGMQDIFLGTAKVQESVPAAPAPALPAAQTPAPGQENAAPQAVPGQKDTAPTTVQPAPGKEGATPATPQAEEKPAGNP